MGVRLSYPFTKKFGIFAETTPGYTYMYADIPVHTMWYDGSVEVKGHCFGLDVSTGFVLNGHLAIGYNYSFFASGNGKGGIHWGRISVIF